MQLWEYLVVYVDEREDRWWDNTGRSGKTPRSNDDLTVSAGVLNDLGAEGWELVAALGSIPSNKLFLKRPKAG